LHLKMKVGRLVAFPYSSLSILRGGHFVNSKAFDGGRTTTGIFVANPTFLRNIYSFTMNINSGFVRGWMACVALLVALATATGVAAQNNPPGATTVVRLHGKARFTTDNQTWQTVKKGAVLQAGAVIQTAANSTVDLRLGGAGKDSKSSEPAEGILRLEPDTLLGIDQLASEGSGKDVELDLRAGQIAGNAGQLPAGARYEVKFSKGIAGVRKGIFHMASSGSVEVPFGETVVVILGADGNPVSNAVTSGKQFDAATGSTTAFHGEMPNPKSSPAPQPETETPSATPPGAMPKGPGLGGSLRKF
jgi:hypothetical protein